MSGSGSGECVLCGAFDDYCMIGVAEDVDCREVSRRVERYEEALRNIRDGKRVPKVEARFALEQS